MAARPAEPAGAEVLRVISLGSNSGGAARPRNRILDEATGEYVFFVDSDDTIGDLAPERIADAVDTTPADWIALNQVPLNGRVGVCRVRQPHRFEANLQAEFQLREIFTASESRKSRQAEHHAVMEIS
jgi:hypothetical protein